MLEVAESFCGHMTPSVVFPDDVAAQAGPNGTSLQHFGESRAVEVSLVDHGGDSSRLAYAPPDRDHATVVADFPDRLLASALINGGAPAAHLKNLFVDEYGLAPVVCAVLLGEGRTLLDVARTGLIETDLHELERNVEGGKGEVKTHLPYHNIVLAGILRVVFT